MARWLVLETLVFALCTSVLKRATLVPGPAGHAFRVQNTPPPPAPHHTYILCAHMSRIVRLDHGCKRIADRAVDGAGAHVETDAWQCGELHRLHAAAHRVARLENNDIY